VGVYAAVYVEYDGGGGGVFYDVGEEVLGDGFGVICVCCVHVCYVYVCIYVDNWDNMRSFKHISSGFNQFLGTHHPYLLSLHK
jgi:hypothetical protein